MGYLDESQARCRLLRTNLPTVRSPFFQFLNPPGRVVGAPVFSRTKKRESYFVEFQSKKGQFDANRVKAHRLSAEAAAYSEEVRATKCLQLPAV